MSNININFKNKTALLIQDGSQQDVEKLWNVVPADFTKYEVNLSDFVLATEYPLSKQRISQKINGFQKGEYFQKPVWTEFIDYFYFNNKLYVRRKMFYVLRIFNLDGSREIIGSETLPQQQYEIMEKFESYEEALEKSQIEKWKW